MLLGRLCCYHPEVTLGEVAAHIADHMAHEVHIVVGIIGLLFVEQLHNPAARTMPGRFAAAIALLAHFL